MDTDKQRSTSPGRPGTARPGTGNRLLKPMASTLAKKGTGFYSETKYKLPGYTGFIPGLQESLGATPTYAQEKTFNPEPHTFLEEREHAPVPLPQHDACNNPELFKKGLPKGQAVNLWPDKQPDPRPINSRDKDSMPDYAKPQNVHIIHGDRRIRGKRTDYQMDYKPPSRPNSARAVDPVTFRVMNSDDPAARAAMYRQCAQRVGPNNTEMMFKSMRARLEAKIDVSTNCNGYKLRRLFKMYDEENTGMVALPEFRLMMESFGIQLSEDQLVVVFSKYDPDFKGRIDYTEMMQDLLDSDYFQFYTAGVNR